MDVINESASETSESERERSILDQFRFWETESRKEQEKERFHQNQVRFISISRQYGCSGFRIGEPLATALNEQRVQRLPRWAVYDKKLIDMVCHDHELERILVESFESRKLGFLDRYLGELRANLSDSRMTFRKCSETIFRLAGKGGVIIIGRAAALITASLLGGLHIRIVAPFDWRVDQVAEYEKINSRQEAEDYVRQMDHERGRLVKDLTGQDIVSPENYDLVLNQKRLGIDGIIKTVLQVIEIKPTI